MLIIKIHAFAHPITSPPSPQFPPAGPPSSQPVVDVLMFCLKVYSPIITLVIVLAYHTARKKIVMPMIAFAKYPIRNDSVASLFIIIIIDRL